MEKLRALTDGPYRATVREDLICNKCKKSLKQIIGPDGEFNFCGLEEVKMVCGYGSLNDGYIYTFSMCEECVGELFKTFKIPPETEDYMGIRNYLGYPKIPFEFDDSAYKKE